MKLYSVFNYSKIVDVFLLTPSNCRGFESEVCDVTVEDFDEKQVHVGSFDCVPEQRHEDEVVPADDVFKVTISFICLKCWSIYLTTLATLHPCCEFATKSTTKRETPRRTSATHRLTSTTLALPRHACLQRLLVHVHVYPCYNTI